MAPVVAALLVVGAIGFSLIPFAVGFAWGLLPLSCGFVCVGWLIGVIEA